MTSLAAALDNGVDREKLGLDLWRRSARLYQASAAFQKAAEAWSEAGDKYAAAKMFRAAADDFSAAALFYDCGRYEETLACAERCRETLTKKDFFRRIALSLVQAAALDRLGRSAAASDLLRGVRMELSELTEESLLSSMQIGQAWESLARFGKRVERPDLVRLGYEKAILIYGSNLNLQRLRCADDYLAAIAADKILSADLQKRIAEFKCDFSRNFVTV